MNKNPFSIFFTLILSSLLLWTAFSQSPPTAVASTLTPIPTVTPSPTATATPTAAPTPQRDPRFGLVEGFWLPEETAELGVGWERIIFYWREVQPFGPEDWNTLHVYEEWLVEAQEQGRFVMGLLKNTPAWARDPESIAGEASLPLGLYEAIDSPENLWANYVRRIARYYGPLGVHNWIIWNEPDIDFGVFGFEFEGDVDDYVRLLKVSALAMREVDPEVKIHLAGMTYWHNPNYLDELLEAIVNEPDAADNDYYFDAVTLHIYFRSETVPSIVNEVQKTLDKHGLGDKEIWINETNAAPTLDPGWPVNRPQFPIDLDQQAWFIVQAYALGFAAGADSIGVYKLLDIALPDGGESFGILRPDQSKRPAFEAQRTVIERLEGFTAVSQTETRQHHHVTFEKPLGQTHVLWARTAVSHTLTLTATLPMADLYSATGDSLGQIQPTNGVYTIILGGATCLPRECLVGGPPLFLVEELPPPTPTPTPTNTPTVTPSPSPSATPTATPSPTATPTATATATPTATPMPTATPTPVPTWGESATAVVSNNPNLWFVLIGGSLLLAFMARLAIRRKQ